MTVNTQREPSNWIELCDSYPRSCIYPKTLCENCYLKSYMGNSSNSIKSSVDHSDSIKSNVTIGMIIEKNADTLGGIAMKSIGKCIIICKVFIHAIIYERAPDISRLTIKVRVIVKSIPVVPISEEATKFLVRSLSTNYFLILFFKTLYRGSRFYPISEV